MPVVNPGVSARAAFRVEEHGAKGDGTTNDSAAIQAAVDACAAAGGGVVTLGARVYLAQNIILRSFVVLEGAGSSATALQAVPSSGSPSVFAMPEGPVVRSGIVGLSVRANGNAGQHGLYFHARPQAAAPNHGGLWHATFDDVSVRDFDGHAIWLRGGTTGFLLPHQFGQIRRLRVVRGDNAASRALLMTGQVGQFDLTNCLLDGKSIGVGTNIELSRQFTNGATVGGSSVGGTADGDNAPYNVVTENVTTQTASKGFLIDRANTVEINGAYLESVHEGIEARNSAFGVVVTNTSFKNAAGRGDGTGYGILSASSSTVDYDGLFFSGTIDRMVKVSSAEASGGTLHGVANGNFEGHTLQLDAAPTVTLGGRTTAVINTSATLITGINSSLPPGESVRIRALGGSVSFGAGGNIVLLANRMLLPQNATATFTRFDLTGPFVLTGVQRLEQTVGLTVPAGSVTFDLTVAERSVVLLSQNVTSSSVINAVSGQSIEIVLVQDATGGRTFTWPTNFRFAGATAPTLTATVNRRDIFGFYFNGTNWFERFRSQNIG